MASQVIGNGPVGFTDSSGRQFFIPLSVLEFSAGEIDATKWSSYLEHKQIVDVLLCDLKANGFLRPGPLPPAEPAMVLEAAVAGAAGNSIRVEFSNLNVEPDFPENSTFDAQITSTDTYQGLSYNSGDLKFIKTILGTETREGTSPCLIRVRDTDVSQPKEGSYPLVGGTAPRSSVAIVDAAKSWVEIADTDDPPGTAFTVEAWKAGPEGNSITVTISDVNDTAHTFTLVVELGQPTITDIKLSDLPVRLAGSGIVLKVEVPEGESFALPAEGTVDLGGGSDPMTKESTSATATVVATL